MRNFDVVIIGSGLAGLQCARLLSRQGAKILLVDRKTDLTRGIHTTGIFVRKTLEDFDFPPATLGKPVRNVTLYSPKLKAINLESEKDEFRVGKMGKLYESFLQDCVQNGVEFASGTRYISAQVRTVCVSGRSNRIAETIVKLEKNGKDYSLKTKVLVGADGAQSRVAKDLKLDENKEWIVGYEEVFKSVPLDDEPRLHCFLDSRLAPGYLAWITNDGEETHIGVGGYAEKFNPREALKEFRQKIAPKFVDFRNAELAETRGGRIPVGGVLQKIANENGLLIGDAAGAVSPLTAGGLDPCLRLSAMAVKVILERLKTDDPKILLNYSGELFRARFVSRLWMRRIIKTFTNQTLLELGFACLRGRIGRKFASHVFFGRGSFPDIEIQTVKRQVEII
ncbi:MAG TPA: NAD(P)/FAD-dependent oxidoreductase [Pyrinomonadaceae bacterium]|nr:NAD(P)/FAD-dependent oxidoreductase [Pyrinomonadaceae bacterium]